MGVIKMLHSSMLTCITHVCSISYEACWLTSPRDMFEMPKPSMSTYINNHPLLLKSWSMLTCITHGFNQNATFKYADLHHPWIMLTYITQVYVWIAQTMYVDLYHQLSFCCWNPCVLYILRRILTYITQGYFCIAWTKYVNLYNPSTSFSWQEPEVCWHKSPIAAIVSSEYGLLAPLGSHYNDDETHHHPNYWYMMGYFMSYMYEFCGHMN